MEISKKTREGKKMTNNGFIKSKGKIQLIQKAILTGVGAAISKDTIKKAAATLYNDIQKEVHKLLDNLEAQGELKAEETKKLVLELQKKSEVEKLKIYKELRKNTRPFLRAAENVLLTPIKLIQEKIGMSKNHRRSRNSRATVKSKKVSGKRAAKKR